MTTDSLRKHIVDTFEQANELSKDCDARYGDTIELSKQDVEALLQGKYIVWTGGEYSLVLNIGEE